MIPSIKLTDYTRADHPEGRYNCVGWSLKDYRWWEPNEDAYWPNARLDDYSQTAYRDMYAAQDFQDCFDDSLEEGFEKVALYVDSSHEFTHVARQLPSGKWTSKLGEWEVIKHESLAVLEGGYYGRVRWYMKRPVRP